MIRLGNFIYDEDGVRRCPVTLEMRFDSAQMKAIAHAAQVEGTSIERWLERETASVKIEIMDAAGEATWLLGSGAIECQEL